MLILKKLPIIVFMILFILILFPILLSAHPLDVTISVLNIKGKTFQVEMNWHPFEVNFLLSKHNKKGEKWKDFKKNESLFFKYIKENFIVYNNGELCEFVPIGMPKIDDAYMYSDGVIFLFDIKSKTKMDKVQVINKLFVEDFDLQTNKIIFFKEDMNVNDIEEIILTSKLTETEQWLITKKTPKMLEEEKNKRLDSDNDLLPDYLEELYGCDKFNPDTDGDGYLDGDEVDSGWDPTDKTPGPGQEKENNQQYLEDYLKIERPQEKDTEFYDSELMANNTDKNYNTDIEYAEPTTIKSNKKPMEDEFMPVTEEDGITIADLTNYLDKTYKIETYDELITENQEDEEELVIDNDLANRRFKELKESNDIKRSKLSGLLNNVLSFIQDKMDDPNIFSKLLLIFPILLLGILHAFETGHGKTILASYLINKNKTLFDALLFITITVFAHIITVTLIGFLSIMLMQQLGEVYNFLPYMPLIGAGIMFIISIFVIKDGIIELKGKPKTTQKSSKYGFLATGVFIGIAPCPIGLGLISMIIITQHYEWLIPVMIIFGLGIFISLFLIALIIIITKNLSLNKFEKLIKYTPVISGILMMFFSVLILVTGSAF